MDQVSRAYVRLQIVDLGEACRCCDRKDIEEEQASFMVMGLLRYAWLALCCGVVVAEDYNFCAKCDANVVQAEWNVFYSAPNSGYSKYLLASHIFDRLFEVDPESKSLFKAVNVDNTASPEFQAHVIRVINGLDICINALSSMSVLEAILDHIATQHFVRQGVTKAHFDTMMKVLVDLLPQALDTFDYDAWTSCICPVMVSIARALPVETTHRESNSYQRWEA
ncbi:Extracellular globin-2B [Lamellibrachia satsuma]|nr:Extracellular globin-2B [Lamellibrachia satsuma]